MGRARDVLSTGIQKIVTYTCCRKLVFLSGHHTRGDMYSYQGISTRMRLTSTPEMVGKYTIIMHQPGLKHRNCAFWC